MKAPQLQSERFSPMGNVVSEGIWNQLGRPELGRLPLLLRESVQNSWDARTSECIDYRVEAFSASRSQAGAFRRFFAETPPSSAYESVGTLTEPITPLNEWLESAAPRLLCVSDRGTRGLDGPTRADRETTEGDERNFVDFLRNVGQPPTKLHGGGTFGYGKAAFYLASETRTIVVYTRCRHRGKLEERLTAAALTHHFSARGHRYTGRHWWGRLVDDATEPVTGEDARSWAGELGLPGFDGTECGTTIGIIAPAFTDEALRELPLLCLRNLWPKLRAPDRGRPPISVRLRVSGHELVVPDPASTPPYDSLFRALGRVRSGTAEELTYRTKVTGRVAFEHAFVPTSEGLSDAQLPEHEVRPRHIALLRAPELVVKYLDGGRSIAADGVGFVGVFLADPAEDRAFALSEPPSHDDWQPATVKDERSRGVVNQALKRLRQLARDFAAPQPTGLTSGEGTSLARLSNEFADLLPGLQSGPTKETQSTPQGGPESPRSRASSVRATIKPHDESEVVEVDGAPYLVFRFDVQHAKKSRQTALRAEAYALLGGGARELEGPSGAAIPTIAWWESPRGARSIGPTVVAGLRQQGTWAVYVPVTDHAAVGIEVLATPEGAP